MAYNNVPFGNPNMVPPGMSSMGLPGRGPPGLGPHGMSGKNCLPGMGAPMRPMMGQAMMRSPMGMVPQQWRPPIPNSMGPAGGNLAPPGSGPRMFNNTSGAGPGAAMAPGMTSSTGLAIPPGVNMNLGIGPPTNMGGAPGIANMSNPTGPGAGASTNFVPVGEKGVTVFVGNISANIPDKSLESILRSCSTVTKWKRVKGAAGNLQSFGFCDYDSEEGALRALRVLNGVRIGEKVLKVTVDEKNNKLLEEYKANQAAGDVATQSTEDEALSAQIQKIIKSNVDLVSVADLNESNAVTNASGASEEKIKERVETISTEIGRFRENEKKESERSNRNVKGKEESKRRRRSRSRSRERRKERRTSMERADYTKDRAKAIENEERRLTKLQRDSEYELKELERITERKDKERVREFQKKQEREEIKENDRLRAQRKRREREMEFAGNFDDEHDDAKYFSSSVLKKLRLERAREVTQDERDKSRESEVLGELPDDEDDLFIIKKPEVPELVHPEGYFDEAKLMNEGLSAEEIAAEKKSLMMAVIARVPQSEEVLFQFDIPWEMLSAAMFVKRIQPWVNKKITEYIGEEEPSLTEFICDKVKVRTPAAEILTDVAQVLDEEANIFVVKLWRLLIYECEAARLNLSAYD
ncbi:hypothetical protein, variant [Sphaeroforma arctica JP610]|uniref:PWI domain-containing protein n=1 Tax=Sphaeroforma arctica JP610 TaxID=667725 RepID=A0A0L0FZ26_9EUKA|nr:hypothetical protein, variant [Sphaeroforma arctica JP610]KNC81223.1 hypothetical protein, variant [Sphaeroforma arctica JP610]|eukprot:XP_014155125.1 hypothetical protein, variant [Sphaeroforma arctica JP610]